MSVDQHSLATKAASPATSPAADALACPTATVGQRLARRSFPLPRRRASIIMALMLVLALALIAWYMTVGVSAGWDFVLLFRGRRVAAMVLVGIAIAVSTVAFQTLTGNRILTPSIMGFDALYQTITTGVMFVLGGTAAVQLGELTRFSVSLTVMLAASLGLFLWLFAGAKRSIHIVLLVGIVLGTLLRSVNALMVRMMDPAESLVLQGQLFASFTGVDESLLIVGAVIVIASCGGLFAMRRTLDVMALGQDTAVALGVAYRRSLVLVIALICLLVATSTALVGPITFFGLLVANLAYAISRSHRHADNLPLAALLAVVTLVGGQLLLEHVLNMGTVLSVVIDFVGGIAFIALLIVGLRKR